VSKLKRLTTRQDEPVQARKGQYLARRGSRNSVSNMRNYQIKPGNTEIKDIEQGHKSNIEIGVALLDLLSRNPKP
jgi:hypothetical protein